MVKYVRKRRPVGLPYDIIEPLYENGYSTEDIASIIGTSPGSVARGIKNRVMKGKTDRINHMRPKGKRTMRQSPNTIYNKLPEFKENMEHKGYLERFESYYREVSMIQLASFIKSTKSTHPTISYTDIADELGMSHSTVHYLNRRTREVWLTGQQDILGYLEQEKGFSERMRIEATLLRRIYQIARTAFTVDAKRERQFKKVNESNNSNQEDDKSARSQDIGGLPVTA